MFNNEHCHNHLFLNKLFYNATNKIKFNEIKFYVTLYSDLQWIVVIAAGTSV